MKRSSLPLILIVFACFRGFSQASLGFVNVSPPQPNLHINDTLKFGATLYNYGNAAFADSVVFGLLHNGNNIANPSIFPRPYPGPPTLHLNPGDSIRLNIAIIITSNNFIVGPTGVVIWPIALNQNILVHDSIDASFNIAPANGINELLDNESLLQATFINGSLHLTTLLDASVIKDVSLYALTGQLLLRSNESLPMNLPVEKYCTGVFLVQLRLLDGEQLTKKIFISPGK